MADYYLVLARAVSSLTDKTPEARQALYERARSALMTELNAHDPPLTDAEITRERNSLEVAIRNVEKEWPLPSLAKLNEEDHSARSLSQPTPEPRKEVKEQSLVDFLASYLPDPQSRLAIFLIPLLLGPPLLLLLLIIVYLIFSGLI